MKSKQRNNRHRYQCEHKYKHTRICEQLSTDGKLLLLHGSFACGLCCRKQTLRPFSSVFRFSSDVNKTQFVRVRDNETKRNTCIHDHRRVYSSTLYKPSREEYI